MSKNSVQQNYNSLKDYILAAENGRKRKQRPVRREKFIKTANHPLLRYEDENEG
jgi:hypothetical protein